ncbi:DNA/RNA-binding winged helix domain-containing protein, partial [Desulfovibrio desulfuricans]|uniref:DNA/RNA-binding winged helix domain-containing protein n=1 Tax=Desulfovibrio desulfuricans TaxID=876 RepID=UPI0023B0B618
LRGIEAADEARLRALTGVARSAVEAALQLLSTLGDASCLDKDTRCWVGKIPFEKLLAASLERGADLHRREPLNPGFTRGALCTGWSRNLPPKLVHKVVDQ